jgi:hypothetical protein
MVVSGNAPAIFTSEPARPVEAGRVAMTGRAAGLRLSARRIDGIFRALPDPTHRRVLERLDRSPPSVSELAAPAGRPVGCAARTHIISLSR